MSVPIVEAAVILPSEKNQPHVSASVAEQLAEVYALADELHALTDRIKTKVDSVISQLPPRPHDGAVHDPQQ